MRELCCVFGFGMVLGACGPPPQAEDPDRVAPEVRVDGQSYVEALQTICDVDRLAGGDPEDPLATATGREAYLVEHVKNPDGRYFLTIFRTKGPTERAAMLENEKGALKLEACPLIATLRADAAGDG